MIKDESSMDEGLGKDDWPSLLIRLQIDHDIGKAWLSLSEDLFHVQMETVAGDVGHRRPVRNGIQAVRFLSSKESTFYVTAFNNSFFLKGTSSDSEVTSTLQTTNCQPKPKSSSSEVVLREQL